jgi:hypothetical protein
MEIGGDLTAKGPLGSNVIVLNDFAEKKGKLQNLDTTTIEVAGNFDSTAPIGADMIQGNKFESLQNLDTTTIEVAGNLNSTAPIGADMIQGNKFKKLQNLLVTLNIPADWIQQPIQTKIVGGNIFHP